MIFKNDLNCEAVSIEKSIKSDLENKNLFVSVDKDTADAGVELLPPLVCVIVCMCLRIVVMLRNHQGF